MSGLADQAPDNDDDFVQFDGGNPRINVNTGTFIFDDLPERALLSDCTDIGVADRSAYEILDDATRLHEVPTILLERDAVRFGRTIDAAIAQKRNGQP